MRATWKRSAAALMALSVIAAACGDDDDSAGGSATEDTGGAATAAPATTAAEATGGSATGGSGESLINGEIPCEQQYAGKTIEIMSPARNSDTDQNVESDYINAYQPLIDCTGVEITWSGSDQFETEVNVRLEGGNAPDVIDFPQPGLLAANARAGHLFPLPDDVAAHVSADFIAGWDVYSTVDGKVFGMPGRSNVKSMIWYSPSAFTDGGYAIPTTLDELKTLSDQIVTDGHVPWCVGAESGVATGWVLTDWMEDFMLRLQGPDVYDQWVNHEIPFNDPKVAEVADAVGAYVKNPDYLGGENNVKAIATTKFQDGGLPILTGDCYMHRQANFYAGLWPEGTNVAPDGDIWFFYLPSNPDGPKYMLTAGDIYAAGTDKPETYDVIRYTGSAEYSLAVANTRKEPTPNKNIDINAITDPYLKAVSELQATAEVARFDASDLMPGAVGAGTLWKEITAWVVGEDTQTFLDNVEASWPTS
ncbi:MAG TPA: ABC transporter substrate-binding protein [Vicinamibacterales bacterium]|nr:ABC transporter substrate-binding protein [Vicinamibacterales bacterium]